MRLASSKLQKSPVAEPSYQVTKDKPFKIVGLDLGLDSSNNIMWNSNQALDDENIIIIAHSIKGREVSA